MQRLAKVRRIDSLYVFPGRNGASPVNLWNAWRYAIGREGIEDFRFHDLRHSAASYLAMNGANLTDIAEVLGHKALSMAKRYTHLSEQHTARVVEADEHGNLWRGGRLRGDVPRVSHVLYVKKQRLYYRDL
jgi:integrase